MTIAVQLAVPPLELVIIRDILDRQVPQSQVLAFGLRVKGTAKAFSDLDLAIVRDSPLPLGTLASLAEDFSESDLPSKVDIVDSATADPSFRARIETQAIPLRSVLSPGNPAE